MASSMMRNGLSRGMTRLVQRSVSAHSTQRNMSILSVSRGLAAEERVFSWMKAGVVLGLTGAAGLACFAEMSSACEEASVAEVEAGGEVVGLPVYTMSDIAKHNTPATRIWVTYKSGVYDITDFIANHPGGKDKIMMAAGGSIAPFWALYAAHNKDNIREILESMRIGNLDVEDQKRNAKAVDTEGPYANEPTRHPALKVNSAKPFNAESPTALLVDSFITPNDLFFTRNHLPVPDIKEEEYSLEITGKGLETITLSLSDLKRLFKKYEVVSSVQCAGNRRSEMNAHKAVKGLGWSNGAISNAKWGGARLRDVLRHAGLDLEDEQAAGIRHVQFEGADTDGNMCYGGSIPVHKAVDMRGDVLLAYEMNGEPIPRDHGYPVRAVVPGYIGARNVKWVKKVVASTVESPSFWQHNDYKGFSPNVDWSNVDYSKSPAITELPVQSGITEPRDGATVSKYDDEVEVKGYAYSGGGRGIVRVDVSADGGETWHTAELNQDALQAQKPGRSWAWAPWTVSIPVSEEMRASGRPLQLCSKAVDTSYNVQPDTVGPIWNLRGVLSNAWSRANVTIVDE